MVYRGEYELLTLIGEHKMRELTLEEIEVVTGGAPILVDY